MTAWERLHNLDFSEGLKRARNLIEISIAMNAKRILSKIYIDAHVKEVMRVFDEYGYVVHSNSGDDVYNSFNTLLKEDIPNGTERSRTDQEEQPR